MSDIVHDMEVISSYLLEAEEYGLLTEVVFYALKAMKENPQLTESQAIVLGYEEWVK